MGSYNVTCGVTNLPINEGDDVVILPITSTYALMSGEMQCYIHDRWKPCSLPFFGQYNDYGWFDNFIDTPINIECLKSFYKEHLVAQEIGQNESHERAVDPNLLVQLENHKFLKNLQYPFSDGRLLRRNIYPSIVGVDRIPLSFMFFHKFAYDELMKLHEYADFRMVDISLDEYLEISDQAVDEILKEHTSKLFMSFTTFNFENPPNWQHGFQDIMLFAMNFISNNRDNPDDIKNLFREITKLQCVLKSMNDLRKPLSPPTVIGQDCDYEVHKKFLQATFKHVALCSLSDFE